ncbi:unnamed protein product [Arabidopsis halleri]
MQGYDWSSCWRWKNREADAQQLKHSHGAMEEVNINTLLTLVRLGVIAPPGQKDGLIAARMTDHLKGQDADSAA